MRPAEATALIDDARRSGVMDVTFTGGEPLLNMEALLAGVAECQTTGLRCHINSNLTLMAPETLDSILACGAFDVLTSIAGDTPRLHDGAMGRRGAFSATIAAVKLLKSRGVTVSVNMVVTSRNFDRVYETGLLAHDLGISVFAATKASVADWGDLQHMWQPSPDQVRQSLAALLRLRREGAVVVDVLECYPHCLLQKGDPAEALLRHTCSAGRTSMAVGPDGSARACAHSGETYGNAITEGICAVFARMDKWRDSSYLAATCRECSLLGSCSGGCRIEAELAHRADGMDPFGTHSPTRHTANSSPAPFLVPIDDALYSMRDVRYRPESFGYLVMRRGTIALLDPDAWELFRLLQNEPMSLKEAAERLDSDITACQRVASGLMLRGMMDHKASGTMETE